jgi:predicted AlkP superfamily phosphohydrolase/phosphomutase
MTKESKVVVIGIDGLDANLLLKFQDDLPHFAELIRASPLVRMSSVFPPDSPTAWASIFTGLNPAKHGVISFKDPVSNAKVADYTDYAKDAIAGRTFWDFAGRNKKKCCIIFPHSSYPPWPVNGIMVSRTTEADLKRFDIKTYPTDLSLRCNPDELRPVTSFPTDPGHIIEPTRRVILNETRLAARFLADFDWDVFFMYFSSLDNIQHVFWRYFDENDPSYSTSNRYRNVIPQFYKFYDSQVIGKLSGLIEPKDALIVVSDHGHGMRPYNTVSFNEILSRAGLLETKMKSQNFSNVYYLQDLAKRKFTTFIDQNRVAAKVASKILSLFPRGLGLYTGLSPIDWDQTMAYLSDSSAGLKTYSYAGVRLRENPSSLSYEQIRQTVIDLLMKMEDPESSNKIVEWANRREELYDGPYLSKYPDVIFKLKDDWGVDWNTGSSLFGKSITHKLFSGTHRQDSAVFLIHRQDKMFCSSDEPGLTDVTPTILHLLGFNYSDSCSPFDGKNLISDV